MGPKKKVKNTKTELHKCGQLIFDTGPKGTNGAKTLSLTYSAIMTGHPYEK